MRRFGTTQEGWQACSDQDAQTHANAGRPAAAMWKNPTGGHGHTAIVRPGTLSADGPTTAQAGAVNFNVGHAANGFGSIVPDYFWHA